MKKITIKDVAQHSGFSTATVSRVLNGETNFPEATRKKVWASAHSLGYEPSIQARNLRSGCVSERIPTNLIMYLFNLPSGNPIGDRVTADSAQMFDWLAGKRGYYVTTYRYFQNEGFHCPLILDRLIDGAVIGCPHQDVIECVSRKVPTVLLNVGASPLFPEIPRVGAATETGLRALMLKAFQLGHRKTALVGSVRTPQVDYFTLDYISLILRLASETGFELTENHRYQPSDLNPGNHEQKMGEIAAILLTEIRAGKVSLIFCEDSCYAMSIYSRLTAAGIRIPDEVSMITVDSSNPTPPNEYPIAAVMHDWQKLYIAAIDVLKELIGGKELACREFAVPVLINEGKTLGKVPLHISKYQ